MNRDWRGGVFQPTRLEVDEGLLEKGLQILPGPSGGPESEAEKLFLAPTAAPKPLLSGAGVGDVDLPSVEVTPEAGMCVKTRNIAGQKVFVNVCKINEIPPARPISEEQLRSVIAEEDYASDFRVPMSLGAPREEKDKSGGPCHCADVAVNSAWYEDTMENNLTFTTFLIHVAMEGLCEKYGDVVNLDRQNWSILKNKKYMGRLQRHRIQRRAIGNEIKELSSEKSLKVMELDSSDVATRPGKPAPESVKKPLISALETTSLATTTAREQTPNMKLFKEPKDADRPDCLIAQVELPGVRSAKEVTLDVGGDRIVVEARRAGFLLDTFVPFDVDQDGVRAEFHKEKMLLTISMPLLG